MFSTAEALSYDEDVGDWKTLAQSWPVERARVIDSQLAANSPLLAPDREQTRRDLWLVGPMLLAVVSPLLLAILAMHWTGPYGWLAFATAAAGFVGMIAVSQHASRYAVCRDLNETRRRDLAKLEEMGASTLDGHYVGVAYADGPWVVRSIDSSASWDRGTLQIGLDKLRYRGVRSSFELRPEQILGIEVRRRDVTFIGPQPRVYVRWIADDGKIQTLSLEVRDAGIGRTLVEATEELRVRLEDWRTSAARLGRLVRSPQEAFAPLRSSDFDLRQPEFMEISSTAKVLGALAGLGIGIVPTMMFVLLIEWLGWRPGNLMMIPTYLSLGLGVGCLGPRIDRRLPERFKKTLDRPIRIRPPVEDGETKLEVRT